MNHVIPTAAEKVSAAFLPDEIAEAVEPAIDEIAACPNAAGDGAPEQIAEEPDSAAIDLSSAVFSLRKVNPNELRTLRRDLREDVKDVEAESGERAVVLGMVVPESFWWLHLRPQFERFKRDA